MASQKKVYHRVTAKAQYAYKVNKVNILGKHTVFTPT